MLHSPPFVTKDGGDNQRNKEHGGGLEDGLGGSVFGDSNGDFNSGVGVTASPASPIAITRTLIGSQSSEPCGKGEGESGKGGKGGEGDGGIEVGGTGDGDGGGCASECGVTAAADWAAADWAVASKSASARRRLWRRWRG